MKRKLRKTNTSSKNSKTLSSLYAKRTKLLEQKLLINGRNLLSPFMMLDVCLYVTAWSVNTWAIIILKLLQTNKPNNPPSGFLIDVFVEPELAEEMIGNLENRYTEVWIKTYHPLMAKIIFQTQSIICVAKNWSATVVRLFNSWLPKRD